MKPLLQFLINLLIFITISFVHFCGLLWTGKLPKVSIYHDTSREHGFKKVFYDVEAQARPLLNYQEKEFEDKIFKAIKKCPELDKLDIAIRESDGTPYGSMTVYSYLTEEISNKK